MTKQNGKYTIRAIEDQVHVTDETGWGKNVTCKSEREAAKLETTLFYANDPMKYIEAIMKSEDYRSFMREIRIKKATEFWTNEYREAIKEGYPADLSEKYATENTNRYYNDVKFYSKIK